MSPVAADVASAERAPPVDAPPPVEAPLPVEAPPVAVAEFVAAGLLELLEEAPEPPHPAAVRSATRTRPALVLRRRVRVMGDFLLARA
jgi:hypothetical protein